MRKEEGKEGSRETEWKRGGGKFLVRLEDPKQGSPKWPIASCPEREPVCFGIFLYCVQTVHKLTNTMNQTSTISSSITALVSMVDLITYK